jgi:hypothetical protein
MHSGYARQSLIQRFEAGRTLQIAGTSAAALRCSQRAKRTASARTMWRNSIPTTRRWYEIRNGPLSTAPQTQKNASVLHNTSSNTVQLISGKVLFQQLRVSRACRCLRL